MSAQAFSTINPAAQVQYLPQCRYGCGEMLLVDDGYQCPICNFYRSPDRHHPGSCGIGIQMQRGDRSAFLRRRHRY